MAPGRTDSNLPRTAPNYGRGMLNSDCQLLVPDATLKSIYVLGQYSNNLVFWDKRPNKAIIQMDHDRSINKAHLGVNQSYINAYFLGSIHSIQLLPYEDHIKHLATQQRLSGSREE